MCQRFKEINVVFVALAATLSIFPGQDPKKPEHKGFIPKPIVIEIHKVLPDVDVDKVDCVVLQRYGK